jgi:hypothetical protein
VLQNIRDQIQRRQLVAPAVRPLRFSGEDEQLQQSVVDDAFGALAYDGMPRKAPLLKAPPAAPPQPQWLIGAFSSASYNYDHGVAGGGGAVAGTAISRTVAFVDGANVTKIGVFTDSDAVTFLVAGTYANTKAGLTNTRVPGTTETLAYVNGGFAADFSFGANFNTLDTLGVLAPAPFAVFRSTSLSYAANLYYKFELANAWFVEPQAGATYTETYTYPGGAFLGDSTEVRGGLRVGTEWMWNALTWQPSFLAVAYSPVEQNPVTPSRGHVGARETAKMNVVFSPQFSGYLQVDGRQFESTWGVGVTGGATITF